MKNLFKKLREKNIHVSLQGANLQINSSEPEIPQDLFEELKLNKEEIISYLKRTDHDRITNQSIPEAPPQSSYVLSSSQRRLWILSQFEQSNIAYNMPCVYVFEGDLDFSSLERSFQTLIERHEILRTVFRPDEESGDEVRQFINAADQPGFKIKCEDLRGHADQQASLKQAITDEFSKPFDLYNGPLLRACLLRLQDNKWIFTYTMHHIISDGWSMDILLNQLLLFYNTDTRKKAEGLLPLSIQYKDYAVWQQQLIRGEGMQHHKAYWLDQFGGELPVLQLPSDKMRPAIKTYNGGMVTGVIDRALTQQFKKLNQEQGATLFMGLVSAVNILLYRYTGQQDIITGTPIAGREHADLEDQIGLYVNTLALRVQFKGSESYRELLENIKTVTLGAYKHQAYPFDELVEELHLQRDIGRHPLFDVMIVLQDAEINYALQKQNFKNLKLKKYENIGIPVSKFDLTFSFLEVEDGIEVYLEYNSDIFNRITAERVAAHLEQMITAICEQPARSIGQLDYLSSGEKHQILASFNDTTVEYSRDRTIIDLLEEQARLFPERIVLKDDFKSYTYAGVENISNRIAKRIIDAFGTDNRTPIAVLLKRSADMVITLLGILKSGRPYVGLDATFPAERLNYMLSNSHCDILIRDKESAFEINKEGIRILMFEDLWLEIDTVIINTKPFQLSPQDPVYIMYTSGSTGNPKGIAISHRSVVNFLISMTQRPGIVRDDLLFAVSTYSFDISVLELFLPLISGAVVYIAGNNILSDPQKIIDKIEEIRPTIIQATPGFYQMLFDTHWKGSRRLKVLYGGDLLPTPLAEKLLESSSSLWNMYGPTETTVWCTVKNILSAKDTDNIGRQINNVEIFILDKELNPVPIGVVGTIYIGGIGLAKGYYLNDDLTKQNFIASPFDHSRKIYETGDLGKWTAEGEIQFFGRRDNQVKVRGYRIELGEIECALQACKGIDAAVVAVKTTDDGEKELVGYVVSETEINIAEIRAHLGRTLPGYMVPGHYVQLQSLPLTPTGKVNRKKLPDPKGLQIFTGITYVAPRNEIQSKLAEIWSNLLGIEKEKIGINDNFFELGGHSLKAIKMIAQIKKQFTVGMNITDAFVHPTIESISAELGNVLWVKKNERRERDPDMEELLF